MWERGATFYEEGSGYLVRVNDERALKYPYGHAFYKNEYIGNAEYRLLDTDLVFPLNDFVYIMIW